MPSENTPNDPIREDDATDDLMGRGSPQNQQQHHGRDVLDPLLIGILGILAGFLVVTAYHCIGVSNFLRRRQLEERSGHRRTTPNQPNPVEPEQPGRMFVYSAECDGKRSCEEGTCAVCLGEYEDGEVIRALPGCLHAFHAACVDTWLSSHSSCPLCRGCTEPPPQAAIMRDASSDASPMEERRGGLVE